jgi:hypothetical protein
MCKTKFYEITDWGTLIEKTTDRVCHHVSALTKAKALAKLLQFARRALNEPPVLRKKGDATQLAYHDLHSVQVVAGYGGRTDLCMSHADTMGQVTDKSASFHYYAGLAAETDQAACERMLGDLLAVIHRDGGHYQSAHGTVRAVEDAKSIVSGLIQKNESDDGNAAVAWRTPLPPWSSSTPDAGNNLEGLTQGERREMHREWMARNANEGA